MPGTSGLAGLAKLGETTGLDDLTDPLGRVTIGDRTVLGQGGNGGPLGVSVLSPSQQSGSVATVGVLSNGQVAAVALGQPNTAPTQATGPATSLLGLNVGGHQVVGSSSGAPLVDLNVLSPGGASGTAVSGNLLSNGQPVAVGVAGPNGPSPVQGVLGGVGQTVQGVVGGVLHPSGGASPVQGVVGGVGQTVQGVVGGVLKLGGGGDKPGGLLGGLLGGPR